VLAQTIVVVTTISAATSQKTWLSPESLTALTAADRGFAAFGFAAYGFAPFGPAEELAGTVR
jgi:hypothetical protein